MSKLTPEFWGMFVFDEIGSCLGAGFLIGANDSC